MKRATQFLALLIISSLFFVSCIDGGLNCIDPDQDRVTETRDLSSFTGVKLAMEGTVNITQGDEQKVEITGSQNILNRLDLDIRNNTLILDINRCILGNDNLIFDITLPKIEELLISGSGNMETLTFLDNSDLYLAISGSGNMYVAFEGDEIESKISGSGNLELEGTTENAKHKISGSGNIEGFDLTSETAETNVSGSGDIEVRVSKTLSGKISGSGNVSYKGNPDEVQVNITGSGRVIDAN